MEKRLWGETSMQSAARAATHNRMSRRARGWVAGAASQYHCLRPALHVAIAVRKMLAATWNLKCLRMLGTVMSDRQLN